MSGSGTDGPIGGQGFSPSDVHAEDLEPDDRPGAGGPGQSNRLDGEENEGPGTAPGHAAAAGDEIDPAKLAAERAASQRRLTTLITEFNRRYAVVNEAGKVWVFESKRDPMLGRQVLDRIAFADFKRLYQNRRLTVIFEDGKKSTRTRADWWLDSRERRQFLGGVTFDPTRRAPVEYWNLWCGFAVEPAPGDWSLMREHIEKVICSSVRDRAEYLFGWLARLVQFPEQPGEVAVVLRGPEGAGKGIFGRWIVAMLGQHGLQINHAGQLVGRFNEHLRDLVFLFADEAFFAGDKKHEGVLKGLITEPHLTVEGKYQRIIAVRNMLHILMSSNQDWVIPAALAARRFFMLDVPDMRVGDLAYFAAIDEQLRRGGLAAMLYDLLNRNISDFEIRAVPQTEALKTQKTLSLDSLHKWWLAVLERGFLYRSRFGSPYLRQWQSFYTTELLWRSYLQWTAETRTRTYDCQGREDLGRLLSKLYTFSRPQTSHPIYELDSIDAEVVRAGSPLDQTSLVWQDHPRGYAVGELIEARVRFTEICNVDTEWGLDP